MRGIFREGVSGSELPLTFSLTTTQAAHKAGYRRHKQHPPAKGGEDIQLNAERIQLLYHTIR